MIHRSLKVLRGNLSIRDNETINAISNTRGEDYNTNFYKMSAVGSSLQNPTDQKNELSPATEREKQLRATMVFQFNIHKSAKENLERQMKNRIYITFVKNYRSKKLITSNLILLAIFLTVLILSCVTNVLIFFITYYNIKDNLDALNVMNAVTNSINMYGGLLYKQYHILDSPNAKPLTANDYPVSPRLLGYQRDILDTKDNYLRWAIIDTDLCLLLKPVITPQYYTACRESTGFNSTFSMYSALSRVLSYYQELANLVTRPSRPPLKAYVEQKTVADNELLSTFCLLAFRQYSVDYSKVIQSDLAQRVTLTGIFMWLIYIELIIGSLIFWRVWTRRKLLEWHRLMHTYLVMNDHLLDNEYLKAYFSFLPHYRE